MPALAALSPRVPRVTVLGLGNTILTDDAIGVLAAREVGRLIDSETVSVTELCWGGFAILDELDGTEWAILLDAIQTGESPPGTITEWAVPTHCPSRRLISYHDLGFFTALEMGRMLGMAMPDRVTLLTVEAEDVETVGERLTPAVEGALAGLVGRVIQTLERGGVLRDTGALAGAGI
ncbi:MAG: hydrogenase maturation protease [Candidatus Sumerlaeia bacterium]|nr:hydrogenase maturation protease [Candidatus Sumerlaeia bacterium]